jgi:FlaG/FlaF family flagellin (archaellin)
MPKKKPVEVKPVQKEKREWGWKQWGLLMGMLVVIMIGVFAVFIQPAVNKLSSGDQSVLPQEVREGLFLDVVENAFPEADVAIQGKNIMVTLDETAGIEINEQLLAAAAASVQLLPDYKTTVQIINDDGISQEVSINNSDVVAFVNGEISREELESKVEWN